MKRLLTSSILGTIAMLGLYGVTYGVSGYATSFISTYPASPLSSLSTTSGVAGNLCTVCHGPSGGARNAYGSAYAGAGHVFSTIENFDSDGDTFTNITEINAGTFPGNPASFPSAGTDTTAPTVSLSSPAGGAAYTTAQTVAINATATDAVGVTRVEFYDNAALLGTDTTAPYSWSWAITSANNGAHSLTARAYDASNNIGTSAAVNVTVAIGGLTDTTAPAVSLSSPANGVTYIAARTTAINATATDAVGVTRVEFYDNAALLGTDTTAPYSWSWAITAADNGAHTLTAMAYDAAGNAATSTAVTVTIAIQGTTPPSHWWKGRTPKIHSFRLPATSSSLEVPILRFWASDNKRVTGYMVTENPDSTDEAWSETPPTSYTFCTEGSKVLYAFVRDADGNISRRREAGVTITLPSVCGGAGDFALTPLTTEASVNQIANETQQGRQISAYDPAVSPLLSSDLSLAQPVAVGSVAEGGDTLTLQVGLEELEFEADAYVTLYSPSEGGEPVQALTLNSDNEFKPLTGTKLPWRTGITGMDEVISEAKTDGLVPGSYLIVFEIHRTGSTEKYYTWVTSFTVRR